MKYNLVEQKIYNLQIIYKHCLNMKKAKDFKEK